MQSYLPPQSAVKVVSRLRQKTVAGMLAYVAGASLENLETLCEHYCCCCDNYRCPHVVRRDELLPDEVQGAIFARLWPDDYADPPAVRRRTKVTRHNKLVGVRARRQKAGVTLWNPRDRIHKLIDKFGVPAKRLRNGEAVEAGPPEKQV